MAPPKQGTLIHVRLPEPLLDKIDRRRAASGLTRAETIRRMLDWAVRQPGSA